LDGVGLIFAEGFEGGFDIVVFQGEDGGGKEGGVDGSGSADGEGGDGDALGHLDGGEEGIHAVERPGGHGTAEDRAGGLGGDDTGEVGGSSGGADEDFDVAGFGGLEVGVEEVRGAVGGNGVALVGDGELVECFGAFLHGGPVGGTAHEDADEGVGGGGKGVFGIGHRGIVGGGVGASRHQGIGGSEDWGGEVGVTFRGCSIHPAFWKIVWA